MATKVPGDGLAATHMRAYGGPTTGDGMVAADERAMPPALAAAIAKKNKGKGAPAERALDEGNSGALVPKAMLGKTDKRAASMPDMPNDGDADDSENTRAMDYCAPDDMRKLPPNVNGKVAELNEYDYSAAADDNSTGAWKKTADQNSGMLPPGSFQRSGRFPDSGAWKQV